MENKFSFYLACATCKYQITAASVWKDTSDGWVITIGSAISDHWNIEVREHVMESIFGGVGIPHMGLQLFDMDWQPVSKIVTISEVLRLQKGIFNPEEILSELRKRS